MHKSLLSFSFLFLFKRITEAACLIVVFTGAASICDAQNAPAAPFYSQADGFPVCNMFAPGRWGIVGVTIANPKDQPVNLLSSHYFGNNPDLQFARQLWVPPQAKRSAWQPVLLPQESRQTNVGIEALLIDRSGGKEVLLKSPSRAFVYESLLPSSKDHDPVSNLDQFPLTGLLGGDDHETTLLVQLARQSCKMSSRLITCGLDRGKDSLPPDPASLQVLDHLVIGSDRPLENPSWIPTIRKWLYGGGRLWIMLDRVSLSNASLLLGEDLDWTIAGRADLTRWEFRQERRVDNLDDEYSDPLEMASRPENRPAAQVSRPERQSSTRVFNEQVGLFEPPAEMVQILAPDVKPVFTIDRWPAAFWRRAGRGLVLFTTSSPRSWISRQNKADNNEARRQMRANNSNNETAYLGMPRPLCPTDELPPFATPSPYMESDVLRQLAEYFLKAKEKELLSLDIAEDVETGQKLEVAKIKAKENSILTRDALEPYVAEQIGYRIMGRWTVLGVLGIFCLILVVSGVWLARIGGLAHLAWIGPCAALVSALILVIEGNRHRLAVPSTVAEVQLVEVEPSAEDARVSGLLGLYNQEQSSAELGTERGGIFFPALKSQTGFTHRMVWTDLDRWHWENISLSAGLHIVGFTSDIHLDQPLSVRATFGPNGLIGKFDRGSIRDVSDAIIALPSRRNMAVRFTGEDGSFASGLDDQLSNDQFSTSSVLSDEQRRRLSLYRRLLQPHASPGYPAKPTFLAWTAPLETGFTFAEGVHRAGSALLAIHLAFERPAPGTQVQIPAPFLTYRSIQTTGGNFGALYDRRQNQWVSHRQSASKTMLRFQVPNELIPLHIERAILTVDLNAQARPFEVFVGEGAKTEVLATRSSPVGKIRFELDRAELLQPDEEGGIRLGIAIGDAVKLPGEVKASSEWKIDDLQLELVGQILEP